MSHCKVVILGFLQPSLSKVEGGAHGDVAGVLLDPQQDRLASDDLSAPGPAFDRRPADRQALSLLLIAR